jgi:hypothetical protein
MTSRKLLTGLTLLVLAGYFWLTHWATQRNRQFFQIQHAKDCG